MEQSNFIDNKYTRLYYKIIEIAKASSHDNYFEFHHIIPRSLGGDNSKSNIIKLSARQHFICHLLLVKMTEGQAKFKMICAAHHMSVCERKELYKITSITYERLKRERSESMKGNSFGKGTVWTDSQRATLSCSLKNSQVFKDCHNETWKRNISEVQSRGVILINGITNETIGEWRNCTDVANHLGCTRANVKWAVRKGTFIGRKLKSLNNTPHWVRWKDDIDAKPSRTLDEISEAKSNSLKLAWTERK